MTGAELRLDIITVFPDYLNPLSLSLVGRAVERGQVDLRVHDLRNFTHDRHRKVDDTPFGGGPGMVMKPEPWGEAIDSVLASGSPADGAGTVGTSAAPKLVIPAPNGTVFRQPHARYLAEAEWIIIACGRYEGIDGRVAQHYANRLDVLELSIGDYVLAGGEVAALVIAEAAIRLLPGVLGNADSAGDDSFAPDRESSPLEAPVYTKPPEWRGLEVPQILLSGNHGAIAQWRRDTARERTRQFRPDLLNSDP